MKLLLVSAALLGLAAKTKEPAPVDPHAALAKAHGGKVWVQREPIRAETPDSLGTWLTSRQPAAELERPKKDSPWPVNYVAVFKKPAAKGPMTVQFFEKGDPKNVVDQYSPENTASTVVYQASYELNPDFGFNAGRTYVIRVGQILNGKFQLYASGELTLK